ncbi:MAG: hypothetical protein K8U03_26435 [Planctomycetia bacterium]|nr:hypothetical protein [Planctomycetia bacterium]
MNLLFCIWLWWRARVRGDVVQVMFHEVAFPFVRKPLKWNIIAIVNRIMAFVLVAASTRIYTSTSAWHSILRRYGARNRPLEVLPVPSNIGHEVDACAVANLRHTLLQDGSTSTIGHFGTYSAGIIALLVPILQLLLSRSHGVKIVLLGRGSAACLHDLLTGHPDWHGRVVAFDGLEDVEVAATLQACDLMIQPFPDGASTRRTSLMACLAAGIPTITTIGELSEPFWQTQQACAAVEVGNVERAIRIIDQWLAEPQMSNATGARGRHYYSAHFSLECAIAKILDRENATTSPAKLDVDAHG